MLALQLKSVQLYTDGSCRSGLGGWAAILVYERTEKEFRDRRELALTSDARAAEAEQGRSARLGVRLRRAQGRRPWIGVIVGRGESGGWDKANATAFLIAREDGEAVSEIARTLMPWHGSLPSRAESYAADLTGTPGRWNVMGRTLTRPGGSDWVAFQWRRRPSAADDDIDPLCARDQRLPGLTCLGGRRRVVFSAG